MAPRSWATTMAGYGKSTRQVRMASLLDLRTATLQEKASMSQCMSEGVTRLLSRTSSARNVTISSWSDASRAASVCTVWAAARRCVQAAHSTDRSRRNAQRHGILQTWRSETRVRWARLDRPLVRHRRRNGIRKRRLTGIDFGGRLVQLDRRT